MDLLLDLMVIKKNKKKNGTKMVGIKENIYKTFYYKKFKKKAIQCLEKDVSID